MGLTSQAVLLVALAVSALFPFVAEQIMSLSVVEKFVMNILDRGSDLTGRINIYASFFSKMEGYWLWGYGFGNGNVVATRLFGYANAQNALLQWVLQIGLPGTGLLVYLMCTIFKRLKDRYTVDKAMPLIFLIYLYIILGMVETTFSMSFLLWLALIFMISADSYKVNQ